MFSSITLNYYHCALVRFILKMKNALKDQEAALAVERQAALKEQKAQMQGSLELAQAEREEVLQLYSKVGNRSISNLERYTTE